MPYPHNHATNYTDPAIFHFYFSPTRHDSIRAGGRASERVCVWASRRDEQGAGSLLFPQGHLVITHYCWWLLRGSSLWRLSWRPALMGIFGSWLAPLPRAPDGNTLAACALKWLCEEIFFFPLSPSTSIPPCYEFQKGNIHADKN